MDEGLAALVASALADHRFLPRFDASLARRFEADMSARRVRHLRRMIYLGLFFLSLYNITGFVTLPPLAWLNVVLRVAVMMPVAISVVYLIDKVEPAIREALVAFGMLGATAIPLLTFFLSEGPLAPFTTTEILLSVVYATATLGLRFLWACALSAVTVAATAASLHFKPDVSLGMSTAVMVNLVTGTVFGLAANWRIEKSERRAYLLTLQETLRASSLSADNEALTVLSATDALTGLANRRALADRAQALDIGLSQGKALAVIMMDVDHFKRFNDFYGHAAGDDCLRRLARFFMNGQTGGSGFIVRFGGEEFVAILPDVLPVDALAIAERLRVGVEALAIPHAARTDGQAVVTLSLGVAANAVDGDTTIDDLIQKADSALYVAKSLGRNQTGIAFEDRDHEQALARQMAALRPPRKVA